MDVSRNKQLAGAGQVCPRAPWIPHICSFHQMMKMMGVIGDEDIWRRWSYQVCLVGKRESRPLAGAACIHPRGLALAFIQASYNTPTLASYCFRVGLG